MSQLKTIQQLQEYVASAESKVQQTGTNLQAAQKRAEHLIAAIRSDERQRNALEAENERLSDRLDGLYSQLDALDDDDEDGGEAAEIESEIAECQSEISENRAEIQQLEARMSRVMQELQAVQAKVKQYAELLGQYRQALQQMDQMFVGHIKERSTADSGMELLDRMNYASSARQPAGQLAQDVRTCEQERQKIARLQTEITRYLGDNVTVQAPVAQKGTISGHGGTGRTATAGTGQMPGTVPRTVKNTVDNGPSHIETAKTTSADFTPPPVVSMAPPGGKSQADVSDIRQMAQQNRGKWANAAGFSFLNKIFYKKGAGSKPEPQAEEPVEQKSGYDRFVEKLHTTDWGEVPPSPPPIPKRPEKPLNMGQRVKDRGRGYDDDDDTPCRYAIHPTETAARSVNTSEQYVSPFRTTVPQKPEAKQGVQLAADEMSSDRFFSKGNRYEEFKKYWEGNSDYTYEKCEKRRVYVKARDIEGVYLNRNEAENMDRFWTRFERSGYSKEKILSDASKIQTVKDRVASGEKLKDLRNDSELKDTVKNYYGDGEGDLIKVVKCGQMLIFSGDGRHRTVAAQYLDTYIPVEIIGEYVKK